MRLIGIVGTGTGVGKSWATIRLIEHLQRSGVRVAARKPAQSYDLAEAGRTDAELLAATLGTDPHEVCPAHRWYPLAMAPPMAAAALGREPVLCADLVAETHWPHGCDVALIETAGGVSSPIADDADSAMLCRALGAERTVLVADAGLGTIHAVRSSLSALAGMAPVVLLNRFDTQNDLHRRNLAWLRDRDGAVVVTSVAELHEILVFMRT